MHQRLASEPYVLTYCDLYYQTARLVEWTKEDLQM